MKKQTKQTKQTKMATAMNRAVVVHSRRQRFWGIIALLGLFFCGYMLGLNMNQPRENVVNTDGGVAYVASEPVSEPENITVCDEVERLLLQRLPDADDDAENRIDRAKIFASVAERGCPENTDKYVDMARAELEIARAIENDEFDHEETIDVVETYKRLHMQAAAEEIFEKAKKLTNPAIDFILQVEKIINE